MPRNYALHADMVRVRFRVRFRVRGRVRGRVRVRVRVRLAPLGLRPRGKRGRV